MADQPGESNGRSRAKPPASTWRTILRAERRGLGLTQAVLASQAGIATETLRKYENGGRSPTRDSIERLLTALQVPHVTARAILRDLGFGVNETKFEPDVHPDYQFSIGQLADFVEEVPWPQFVVNDMFELVVANAAAQALWGIDLQAELARRSRPRVNFLSIAAERQFSRRIGNWPELMGT
ncbi:MAG: helix-turn-helix domain-containing protein, partial [Candidatus Limnocylindrales bacterium]